MSPPTGTHGGKLSVKDSRTSVELKPGQINSSAILGDYKHLTAATGLILGVVAGSCNLSRCLFSTAPGSLEHTVVSVDAHLG